MDQVNKTLYIPLYGKAYVSRKSIILKDTRAEEIWAAEGFLLKGKSKSKWLAYYMGMRSAVFDRWVKEKLAAYPEAAVLHLGCGMDSRLLRVAHGNHLWFDIDFPEVIEQRRRYYEEDGTYRMIGTDVRENAWLERLPNGCAVVVMEGISMYLKPEELRELLKNLCGHFESAYILMDCYTEFAAKASRYKNPINDVGITQVYGLDDPKELTGERLSFVREHEMTPDDLIGQLRGAESVIFKKVFAGRFAKKMYRLYEYSCG